MTNIASEHAHSARSSNLEALMQVPKEMLKETVKQLTDGWHVQAMALPQAGLGLLKMADGAFHDPFYLGEIPLASAHVLLTPPHGEAVEGAAVMMSDDVDHIEALALCDAILTHQLTGWNEIRLLATEGDAIRQQEAQRRHAMLAKTRVDFSLLNEAQARGAGSHEKAEQEAGEQDAD